MRVLQLMPVPDGLRAVYLVRIQDFSSGSQPGKERQVHIVERPVDALALIDVSPIESRDLFGDTGVSEKQTKIVGVVMEGSVQPQPAPLATEWFERIYGNALIDAALLGYTRSASTVDDIMLAVEADQKSGADFPAGEETSEMRETRRYWSAAVHRVIKSLDNR